MKSNSFHSKKSLLHFISEKHLISSNTVQVSQRVMQQQRQRAFGRRRRKGRPSVGPSVRVVTVYPPWNVHEKW